MSTAAQADVVIVGSGFGGAVAACRLAAPNRSVVVLERGRRWHADALPHKPSDFIYSSKVPHRLNGWLDVRFMDRMVVACGAGVGGGSLVYANVCIDAPEAFFRTGWPSQITYGEMQPYYDAVTNMLAPQPVPGNQHNPRMQLLRTAADKMDAGHLYAALPLAINFDQQATGRVPGKPWKNPDGYAPGTCVHCGNCCIGCPTGAKKTLDQNYLRQAEAQGVHIQPLSMVTHLSEDRGGRWRVHYLDISDGCRRLREIACRVVILAAGSLGSTEILMRTRDEFHTVSGLPRALGRGWSPNGDFLTLARYPGRELEPTKGPTIGAAIDFLDGVDQPDDNLDGVDGQLYVEDGGLPNFAGALLASWKDIGGWKQKIYENADELTDFRSIIPWFGQSIDAADGEFALRSRFAFWRRRLRLDWNPQLSMQALDTFGDMHVAMTLATGGVPMPLLTWKRLRMLVTPHPLGGCNMGSAPGVGVVDANGEVFGHKNLFVMDGAVIPRAIGRNPSKTIAAIAERCCDRLGERLDHESGRSSGQATAQNRQEKPMPEVRATIVQISDLHFGRSTLNHELLEPLTQLIATQIRPEFLIVSGDVANNPRPRDMREARLFIKKLQGKCGISSAHVVVVPGNHDYKIMGNVGFRRLSRVPFEMYFRADCADKTFPARLWTGLELALNALSPRGKLMRDDQFDSERDICYSEAHGVAILSFNSTAAYQKFGLATGKVDGGQIQGAVASIAKIDQKLEDSVKIAVVHHHPIPIAYVSTDLKARMQESFMVFFNAGTFLRELGRAGVDIVLHGHKHYAGFTRIAYDIPDFGRQQMSVLAAGSATRKSPSDPLGNEFNVIRVYDDDTADAEQWYFSAEVGRKDESRRYVLYSNDDVRQRRQQALRRSTGMMCREISKRITLTTDGYSKVETALLGCAVARASGVRDYPIDLTAPPPSYIRNFDARPLPGSPNFLRFMPEDPKKSDCKSLQGKITFGETRMIKDGPFNIGWKYDLINGHALNFQEFQRKYLGTDLKCEYATLWCEEPAESLKLRVEFPPTISRGADFRAEAVYMPWQQRQDKSCVSPRESQHDEESGRIEAFLSKPSGDPQHSQFAELSIPDPIPGFGYRICWRYPPPEAGKSGRLRDERTRYIRRRLIREADLHLTEVSDLYRKVDHFLAALLGDVEDRYPVCDPEERLRIDLTVFDDQDAVLRFVATNTGSIADLVNDTFVPGEGCAGFSFEKGRLALCDRKRDDIGYYLAPQEMNRNPGERSGLQDHTVLFTIPWSEDGEVPVGVVCIGSTCEFSRLLRVFDLDEEQQNLEIKALSNLTDVFGDAVVEALNLPETGPWI